MTRELNLTESQSLQLSKSDLSDQIFNNLLTLVPSNYTSKVEGPFYTLQFKVFADFLADLQISAQNISSQVVFNYTDPDFLKNVLSLIIFPDGEVLDLKNLQDYKSFLIKFVGYLLQGARKEPIQQAVTDISYGDLVQIVDRVTGPVEDSFFIDIYITSPDGQGFPKTDFDILKKNIDIILHALKPAHLAHEYHNLFKESVTVLKPVTDNPEEYKFEFKYQQDMRKNFLGSKSLTGTSGTTILSGSTLQDSKANFSRVRVGSTLVVTTTKGVYSYIVKSKGKTTLTVTTWFDSNMGVLQSYEVELDEVGQLTPKLVTETGVMTDSSGVVYCKYGPLVFPRGDESLATTDAITVTSGTLDSVEPYSGKLVFKDKNTPVTFSYYWFPNPRLPMGRLNTGGAVLNKWGEVRGSSNQLNRFAFRAGLNTVSYPQPLIYSPRYLGVLKSGSTTLNNKNNTLLNSSKLNTLKKDSSLDYLYGKTFREQEYNCVDGEIDLNTGGISVESVRTIYLNAINIVNYTFDKALQKIKVKNSPDGLYKISFIPGSPITRKYLLTQPMDESADILYGGTAPFIEKDLFSFLERLDKTNEEDIIDTSLLQFFSDGVLSSDGFVGIELEVDQNSEFQLTDIIKPEESHLPLYTWNSSYANTQLLEVSPNMTIKIDQTQLYTSSLPSSFNVLTKLTSPDLPQVQVTMRDENTGTSSNYIVS